MRIEDEPSVFVEREFTCAGKPMPVRFYQPTQNPTGEYKCQFEISWPDRIQRKHVHGYDSIQALMLAMRLLHSELLESDAYKAGLITYLDEQDLDLPPAFGSGE